MRSPIEAVAHRAIAAWSGSVVSRDLDLTVEGLAHLPRSGPVLIASRHFHHFYDGCILASRLPRPAHILVGLDWVRSGTQRRLIETACRIARWPVILRADRPRHDDAPFRQDEARGYLRRALTLGATLLREGETLVVFPEGYPNVDPVYTPKREDDEFLPFRSGYLKIVELAQRWGTPPVAVVPAGLSYTHNARGKRWQVTMRLGPPDYLARRADLPRLARAIEAKVHALSSSSSSVPA